MNHPQKRERKTRRKKRKHLTSSSSSSSTSSSEEEKRSKKKVKKSKKSKKAHERIRKDQTPPRFSPECPENSQPGTSGYREDFPEWDQYDHQYGYYTTPQETGEEYWQTDSYNLNKDYEPEIRSSSSSLLPPTPTGIENFPYITENQEEQPPSPPEDMLNKTFYPPEAAVPDMYPETSEIRFL